MSEQCPAWLWLGFGNAGLNLRCDLRAGHKRRHSHWLAIPREEDRIPAAVLASLGSGNSATVLWDSRR
jgi:hypothetical protein